MEILGIGPLELIFILLIALVVLGPNDMVKAGRTIGRFLNRLIKSPTWNTLLKTTQELKHIPTKLMREANLEEIKDITSPQKILQDAGVPDLNNISTSINQDLSAWLNPPSINTETQIDQEQGKKDNQ